MLSVVRRVAAYEMTIAEWIGAALILAIPYLVVGVFWTALHYEHLTRLDGVHRLLSLVAFVVCWPLLVLTDMCTT
jgi:hypothetical protein